MRGPEPGGLLGAYCHRRPEKTKSEEGTAPMHTKDHCNGGGDVSARGGGAEQDYFREVEEPVLGQE